MNEGRHKFSTVDEYMESLSGESLKRAKILRAKIFEMIPGVEEKINYNIPAYFLNSKMVIYFSGYENHVSLYPGRTLSEEYTQLAKQYASGKSTLKFPNSQELPLAIIEEFIALRIKESGV